MQDASVMLEVQESQHYLCDAMICWAESDVELHCEQGGGGAIGCLSNQLGVVLLVNLLEVCRRTY